MVDYSKVNVRLSDSKLNRLRSAVRNQTGATLRINIKMFNGNNLPHELLLTTRQKEVRTAIENNTSTGVELYKLKYKK